MEIGLVQLLRIVWIFMLSTILITCLPFFKNKFGFYSNIYDLFTRGKIIQSSSNKLTVPQKYFYHLYLLAVTWTTLLLLTTLVFAHQMESSEFGNKEEGNNYRIWRSVFLVILMEIQVLRRLYESLFVFHYSTKALMPLPTYLGGFMFYIVTPLSLCSSIAPRAFTYLTNQMSHPKFHLLEYLAPFLKLGWAQWLGALIFSWGWLHQTRCHAILGNLRKGKEQEDAYIIPYGDWFETVSSPHYLAEIVIYVGILVASGGMDFTIWLAFLFVVGNLIITAAETHRWYRRKFDDYPADRYAIIPFVY